MDEVPPIWVDRAGIKANITEVSGNTSSMSTLLFEKPFGFCKIPSLMFAYLICAEQNFTRQSKFTYGLVMEEITTRDESSHICPNGQRVLPSGGISADGPPTTLSGTGIDRMAFLQANITRDNTKFVNGAVVGERNVFQVSSYSDNFRGVW